MRPPKIPAIQTRYKGYYFRSRLEARWAVFFDACGTKWEYEKEGYDLSGGEEWIGSAEDKLGWYLPDFWIPKYRMWVEIKPEVPAEHFYWTVPEVQIWNLVRVTKADQGMVIFGSPEWDTKCSHISGNDDETPDTPLRCNSIAAMAPFRFDDDCFDAAKSARFEFGAEGRQ